MNRDRANRLTAAAQHAARKSATQYLGHYGDGSLRRFGLLQSGRYDFATLNRAASDYSVRVPYLDTDATPDATYQMDRDDLEAVWLEAWQDTIQEWPHSLTA